MALVREGTDMSLQEIAERFHRDGSTVVYAVRVVAKARQENSGFDRSYQRFMDVLRAAA